MDHLLADAIQSNSGAKSPFVEYFVYNTDGRILASSDPGQVGKVVNRQPYFQNSLIANTIQSPYYEIGTSALTMIVTRPLKFDNGIPVGVLAGRLDLAVLGGIMTE